MTTLAATSDPSTRLADYLGTVALVILIAAVLIGAAITVASIRSRSDVQQHSGSFSHTHTGTFQHNVTGTVRQEVSGNLSMHHSFDTVRHVVELSDADRVLLNRLLMQREPYTPAQKVEIRRLTAHALTPNRRGELR